jgi:transcriptional antiterminator
MALFMFLTAVSIFLLWPSGIISPKNIVSRSSWIYKCMHSAYSFYIIETIFHKNYCIVLEIRSKLQKKSTADISKVIFVNSFTTLNKMKEKLLQIGWYKMLFMLWKCQFINRGSLLLHTSYFTFDL